MSAPAGWDDILEPDERILWQGRPDPSLSIGPANIFVALFGTAFAGFAFVWMSLMAKGGSFLWMFGLLHFSVGAALILAALFWPTWQRRRSWYSLSNRRAFIATDMPFLGRTLNSYPIKPDSPLRLIDGSPGAVMFHTHVSRIGGAPTRTVQMHGHPGIQTVVPSGSRSRIRTRSTRIGFERIFDAAHVHALMQRIQKGSL
jgi:hypothetical protein